MNCLDSWDVVFSNKQSVKRMHRGALCVDLCDSQVECMRIREKTLMSISFGNGYFLFNSSMCKNACLFSDFAVYMRQESLLGTQGKTIRFKR